MADLASDAFPVRRWQTGERLRVYPRLLAIAYLVVSIGWFARSSEGIDACWQRRRSRFDQA